MPSLPGRRRRRLLIALATGVMALGIGVAVFLEVAHNRTKDVSNPKVEFVPAPPVTPPPVTPRVADRFAWPLYGYTKARTRYLAVGRPLHPPFRRLWTAAGSKLLEFPPVMARNSLYQLKNDGLLVAIAKHTGRIRWRRKIGALAAASPAVAHGVVYVVLLKRRPGLRAGRVAALDARNGRVRWSRALASRAESSPLIDAGRLYFGTENGTVFALRARDGRTLWTYRAAGAVKGGIAMQGPHLFLADYSGHVTCLRASDGGVVWRAGTSGARFGFGSGQFYSTPAVAFGRVYVGNTDGKVYSFAARSGQLAWRTTTGNYVYGSPAVAQVPGTPPSVYIGSYDGTFYALDARSGSVRWRTRVGGKISGSATVVGDIVYLSNLAAKTTLGLSVRTGRRVFGFGRGAFNPVISDGETIFLTGYSTLYALAPERVFRARARARRLRAARASRPAPGSAHSGR